ncbi:CDP-alcohol phosphatidyltransferase family protein [Puniceicoccales bacterium CK1056]|uniref:CDP-alcohol phosphatidyltransferase family protein n=1 Tax=Oceanipulchritudo coccoides TaxID=2706888 RepID=A0A6B2M4T0_9BACT|nr:CDP-alcohol phosphatidyltransferase family protein [Oceanipulchritudo coccoides]NDV63094.1 CDP-alcohol phosphatidyltransferase family protein [Oceanipulchritudo coccoides]
MKVPTVYQLKPAFQNFLRPICSSLVGRGVTANQVTVFAMVLSILQGIWIYFQPTSPAALLCLPLVLFIRMALNAIDGIMAREFDQKSKLGGILNELGDVVSDVALYLPFAMHPAFSPELVVVFILLAILTEFTGVVAVAVGSTRRYDGPMGKSDRALLFGVIGFAAAVGVPLEAWINWALGAAIVLSLLTVVNRTRKATN